MVCTKYRKCLSKRTDSTRYALGANTHTHSLTHTTTKQRDRTISTHQPSLLLPPSSSSSCSGSNVYVLSVALSLLGLVIGGSCPLVFEFGAELTFPLSESLSAGLISFINNASSLFFLFIAPHVKGSIMNLIMLLTTVTCSILLLPVSDAYKRMDAEQKYDAADGEEDGSQPASGISSSRRRSLIDAHHEEMQREFQRVMKEVDEGLNDPLGESHETK